jgi:hypothetical protein
MPGAPDFEQSQQPIYQTVWQQGVAVPGTTILLTKPHPVRIWFVTLVMASLTSPAYAGGLTRYNISVQDLNGNFLAAASALFDFPSGEMATNSDVDLKGYVPAPNGGNYGVQMVVPANIANTAANVDCVVVYSDP